MGITLNLTDEEANEIRAWAEIHIDEEESFDNNEHANRGRKIKDKILRAKER